MVTVDDQPVFLASARDVIDATPGFTAVGEADCGEAALEVVDRLDPGLVLLDVRMPGMGGIETARLIKSSHPATVVVLISIDEAADLPAESTTSNADALARKQDLGPSLLRRLWKAHGSGSA